jgi:Fe2+ or Zn2+ uptake regulation protein
MDAKDYLKVLHACGHRLTRQRRLVVEIFEKNPGHFEADKVYLLAKERDPNISLATVYRTLALLKESGLLQEHSFGQDHAHFEAAPAEPHYHFTCLQCQRVIEFEAPQVRAMAEALSQREGLKITGMHLLFHGYCAQCQQA